jgi:hypothetical protein
VKGVANKGSTTKLVPNQPNAMEAHFACLEPLVMNMASNVASQVKPIAPTLSDSLTQGFDLKFFYGVNFFGPLGPDGIKSSILNDHVSKVAGDKTLVKVSTTAPITRANAQM